MPAPKPPLRRLHLGISLDGAGSHPGAWREHDARPQDLFTGEYFVGLVQLAERGLLDFVTVDDSFALQPGDGGRVRGRLDALLSLARVAPLTRSIGLVPTVTTTHTEPFHISKNVATLDYVSLGRAGWKVAVSTTEGEAAHFGRKDAAPPAEVYAEAEEAVDVVVRLWDSWEDDAVIRDQATGRYVDRDKLHYVDFEGRFFGVRGPSITPRPPQGHPIVAVDASNDLALPIAGSFADLVFVDAPDPESASRRRRDIRERAVAAGRDPGDVTVLANIDVVLERDRNAARATRERLDTSGGELDGSDTSGALDFVGTPPELAALLEAWFREEAVDGFTIRPAVLPHTLALLVDEVAPILRERGVFRGAYDGATLRDHFGLTRPRNRYAETA